MIALYNLFESSKVVHHVMNKTQIPSTFKKSFQNFRNRVNAGTHPDNILSDGIPQGQKDLEMYFSFTGKYPTKGPLGRFAQAHRNLYAHA